MFLLNCLALLAAFSVWTINLFFLNLFELLLLLQYYGVLNPKEHELCKVYSFPKHYMIILTILKSELYLFLHWKRGSCLLISCILLLVSCYLVYSIWSTHWSLNAKPVSCTNFDFFNSPNNTLVYRGVTS